MSGFFQWLESLDEKDTKVRAVLKRSLAFDPGTFPAAYPYVEPFLKGNVTEWKRSRYYLVAGLWAAHRVSTTNDGSTSFGKTCSARNNSAGFEKRFIALLDADEDQLTHRLRQMTALLKDDPIDFERLLNDLLFWNDDLKRVQIKWARDYYGNTAEENTLLEANR